MSLLLLIWLFLLYCFPRESVGSIAAFVSIAQISEFEQDDNILRLDTDTNSLNVLLNRSDLINSTDTLFGDYAALCSNGIYYNILTSIINNLLTQIGILTININATNKNYNFYPMINYQYSFGIFCAEQENDEYQLYGFAAYQYNSTVNSMMLNKIIFDTSNKAINEETIYKFDGNIFNSPFDRIWTNIHDNILYMLPNNPYMARPPLYIFNLTTNEMNVPYLFPDVPNLPYLFRTINYIFPMTIQDPNQYLNVDVEYGINVNYWMNLYINTAEKSLDIYGDIQNLSFPRLFFVYCANGIGFGVEQNYANFANITSVNSTKGIDIIYQYDLETHIADFYYTTGFSVLYNEKSPC